MHPGETNPMGYLGTKYTLLDCWPGMIFPGIKNHCRQPADWQIIYYHWWSGQDQHCQNGNYRGMPSSSVLEPILFLYHHTRENRYLSFAKYIVEQWETPDGPGLISKALNGTAVADRFPFPSSWWSYENGQKAYEMMSCYEGLLELYRITGQPEYLKAVELAVQNIMDTEINLAGSVPPLSAFIMAWNGKRNLLTTPWRPA